MPASSRRRLVRHVRGCGFFFARLGSYPRHSRAFDRNPLHRSALSQGQYSVLSTLGRLPAGEPSIGLARLSQPHGPTPVVRGHTTLRDICTCIVLWGGVVWCGVENLRRKAAAYFVYFASYYILPGTKYDVALYTLEHQYTVTAVCTRFWSQPSNRLRPTCRTAAAQHSSSTSTINSIYLVGTTQG